MDIESKKVTIRELVNNYSDNQEEGLIGFGGKLDIRPAYQREFVYKDKQRDAVIDTVTKNFPLNTMYWVDNEDGSFELLDGQQRTISICQYVNNGFTIDYRFFHNLDETEQNQILDYELMIYTCKGNHADKLDWFKTINIAGEPLKPQELRNITYIGQWLSNAKEYFSKPNCVGYNLAKDYVKGSPIRQEYLQTVLSWISGGRMEHYMAKHQKDTDAAALWIYFQQVINWVKGYFPNYRKEMKGVDWGTLYNQYKNTTLNKDTLENQIKQFMRDEDVTKKQGIYDFVLTGNQNKLSIRVFNDKQKREVFEEQEGICVKCTEKFELREMEADHITPWSEGGKTIPSNCQMLCKSCNRIKSNK